MSRTERLLTAEPATTTAADPSANAFSTSILVSGVRCLLTYIVFPWALPLFGLAGGVGPALGITIGTVAIGFNVASIRRFWMNDHRWKVPITVVNVSVIILLVVLIVFDVAELAG